MFFAVYRKKVVVIGGYADSFMLCASRSVSPIVGFFGNDFDGIVCYSYLLIALFVVGHIPATVRLAPTCANRFSLGFQLFVETKINPNLEGSVMDYFFDLNHLQFKLKRFFNRSVFNCCIQNASDCVPI